MSVTQNQLESQCKSAHWSSLSSGANTFFRHCDTSLAQKSAPSFSSWALVSTVLQDIHKPSVKSKTAYINMFPSFSLWGHNTHQHTLTHPNTPHTLPCLYILKCMSLRINWRASVNLLIDQVSALVPTLFFVIVMTVDKWLYGTFWGFSSPASNWVGNSTHGAESVAPNSVKLPHGSMTNHNFRATFGDTFILLGEKIFNLLKSCMVKFVAGRALQSKFQVALNKHQEVELGSKMLKTYYMALHSMNFPSLLDRPESKACSANCKWIYTNLVDLLWSHHL